MAFPANGTVRDRESSDSKRSQLFQNFKMEGFVILLYRTRIRIRIRINIWFFMFGDVVVRPRVYKERIDKT